MAVIIGAIHQASEQDAFHGKPFSWVASQLGRIFSRRGNPSPFPDRVWLRHSALLDAAWKRKLHLNDLT